MVHEIILYTDGACSGNPGKGGCAFVMLMDGQKCAQIKRGFKITTNNRMEIRAAIEALTYVLNSSKGTLENGDSLTIDVRSDSQLVVNTMNNGWGRKSNLDLWMRMDSVISSLRSKGIKVSFTKVKGHSGDAYNDQADQLAVSAYENDGLGLMMDEGYVNQCLSGGGMGLFDKTSDDSAKIVNIRLERYDAPEHRKVKVDLSNGTVVSIVGCYGGFQQYGCTLDECKITLDIAELYAGWLNGGKLPGME